MFIQQRKNKFREKGHVWDLQKSNTKQIAESKKLDVLLAFEEYTNTIVLRPLKQPL